MRTWGIITAGVVGLLFALGSSARAYDKEGKITDLVKDATVTIDQAIKTASEKVSGTVVEAELEKKHGKTVWEVEVLGADGNVTEVHIDAGTGAVIDTEAKKDEKKKGAKKGK
ncbi:MAG: PepSY domain-containing protein [Nitrospiraceae bacterium]